jgi:manganese-dependent inorganic pyrophosphatase
MDLANVSLAAIISRDIKEFELSNRKVIISQVMVPGFAWNRERSAEIEAGLGNLRKSSGADLAIVLFTNVMENASDIYGSAEGSLIRDLFAAELPVRSEGVMSRKKDFLPWLGARLREIGTGR